jgi:ATP-dependent Zn protease
VREGLDTARKVVRDYRSVLETIARKLIEVENLEKEDFEKILVANNIPVKREEVV